MDYLYFDIECADGSHICSFGYVIADENFVVKEKNDILIDPRCEFRLGKYRKQPYITLAYDEKQFNESPEFDALYGKICDLLLCKDRVVLGHAIDSDVEFLDIACDRYNKQRINVVTYDTQKIYAHYEQSDSVKSLEKIMEDLDINIEHLSAHKSCDDAEMSMLTLRGICSASNKSITELLAASKKYIVDRKFMEISYRCRKIRKFLTNIKRNVNTKDREKIYINDLIEKIKISKTREMLHAIYNAGYAFSFDCEKCDYSVSDSPPIYTENTEIKYLNYERLSEMLGVTIDSSGNVQYTENESGGNSLKIFFENAVKNNTTKKRKNIK